MRMQTLTQPACNLLVLLYRKGSTALLGAAQQGHSEVVDALLSRNNSNINRPNRWDDVWFNSNEFTALMIAAFNNDIKTLEVLIRHGADLHAMNE